MMLRHKHQFVLRNGLLYKRIQFCSWDQPLLQFVLPTTYRQQAMTACHDDIGLERSLDFYEVDFIGQE